MTRSFAAMLVVVLATLALEAGPDAASQTRPQPSNQAPERRSPAKQNREKRSRSGILIGINTILATPLGPRAAPLGSRAMAMMHVAMADAVASIHPTYKPYAVRVTGHRNSDKVAAAASAAYGVLVRLFPASQPQLDAALAESLAQGSGWEEKRQRHCPRRRSRGADCGAPRE
jgi:hypothetical protein